MKICVALPLAAGNDTGDTGVRVSTCYGGVKRRRK